MVAEAVNEQDDYYIDQPFSDIGDFPRVQEYLKQLNHLCFSAGGLDF